MLSSADFADTYAKMTEGELARVLRGKRSLVPEAVAALDREIQNRNLDPSQLRKQRPRSIDKRRQPTIAEKRLKDKRLHLPSLLALMVLSLMLVMTLDHFGVEQLFWPVCITIFVPVFTVWGFWELKGRLWFWGTIAGIVSANIALFALVGWPWGTHWVPGRAIAGLCTLELIPIFALIARLQKRIDRNRDGQFSSSSLEPHSHSAGKINTNPS
jgi:uncharacterized membrane protein YccC